MQEIDFDFLVLYSLLSNCYQYQIFDVTNKSGELVGLYLLSQISCLIMEKQIGLYRDDGLTLVANGLKHVEYENHIALFKTEGLNITIKTNQTTIDFLVVTFDFKTGKYYPNRKPNDTPTYINTRSNHPPSIDKQLPQMVNYRISDLSCDKPEFDKAKTIYESALKSRGYEITIKYEKDHRNKQNANRK